MGRHGSLVSAAACGRGAGRALPRPATGAPPAPAGSGGGRLAADGGAVGALGPVGPQHSVGSGAVRRRRHQRAPAGRPRGRAAAGRRGGVTGISAARAAARGRVLRCPGCRRDDVRRCALARRRPRAPADRTARAAAAARHPAGQAGGAGRRRTCRTPGTGPQPRLTARAAGRAASGRARGDRHPGLDPACPRPPGHRAAAALQAACSPVLHQRLGLDRPVGQRWAVPALLPARRVDHRPLGVQRRRSPVVPGTGPPSGRGRRRLDVRRRRRRAAGAAGAGRHERRPRAREVGPRHRPLPGHGRRRRSREPLRGQASVSSERCTAPPAARAVAWSPA